ncbi:serine/threonine-protein phosphatase 7 long form homolog [Arachis hypogaea]|uniref:serine/threonine-protein phosphatase 7 long form homolog n=1 Tax=Arachis hypogaea TaxID=3818 RepID=UPI000DECD891|nr:serine/threonine-protein phosphatase 7 long form homolog [Arachis hypogaea]
MNNGSEEDFEATYEADDEDEDGDVGRETAVKNVVVPPAVSQPMDVPSFMRNLDLDAMHAPKFSEYVNKVFDVREIPNGKVLAIDLARRTSDREHFQVKRLPCRHVIACCANQHLNWQLYVNDLYKMTESALINALVERWRPETHTFHFPVGECAVTLEDVALILGLPTNGLPVTGPTMSSYEALEAECLDQFGVAPMKKDCKGSFIKLVWFRALKNRLVLVDEVQIHSYVKCHIMLMFGTVMFGDKSAAGVHWKFLPLLPNIGGIIQFSWGSACLAHLWQNWKRENRPYRYRTLENYRRDLDLLQEGQFVWEPYAIGKTDPDVIPADIRQHAAIWSARVPLISFECIEWHASDRHIE